MNSPAVLLEHLSCVQLTGQLLHAVITLLEVQAPDVKRAFQAVAPGGLWSQAGVHDEDRITDKQAQITALVVGRFGDVALPNCSLEGWTVQNWIQQAVYGSETSGQTLMQLVAFTSRIKAEVVRQMCLYLLEDMLSHKNCLRLLSLARLLALPVLEVASAGLALRSFSQVAAADAEGLRQLDLHVLGSLLTSSTLQADAEWHKFEAVAAWIYASPLERTATFSQLFGTIDLNVMSQRDLILLDMHPLVVEDLQATGCVAHAFIALMFGTRTPVAAGTGGQATPPSAAGDVRQCFQSAGSSLFRHLCDTASTTQAQTPASAGSSLVDLRAGAAACMDIDSPQGRPAAQATAALAQPGPSTVQERPPAGTAQTLLEEAEVSPSWLHRQPLPKAQSVSCKRRLFKC